ncbi:MAG: DegT/DnrJ/EryC1/StrS family aminotransferase [Bacteroidota bacterium]
MIRLACPDITDAEVEEVIATLRSPHLSLGPRLNEFEQAVASYVGRRHAIAVSSGTAGLHLAVRALGLGEGDEVITTPFSFVASSNCLLYERVRPVFVDVEPETGNIDPELVARAITARTKAILPVDVFGQPARLDAIRALADRHGLAVLEDACEALGSAYKGVKCGNGAFADAAVFAFYPNKQITTGEGGMIVTDDDGIAALCRSMRNQGRAEGDAWLSHERLGYNYRLDELSAALGAAQMRRLDEIIARRAAVAAMYQRHLGGVAGVRLPAIDPGTTCMSWFVYVVRVGSDEPAPEKQRAVRDHCMASLRRAGIESRPYFPPIHLQPFYRRQFGYAEGDFPRAEEAGRTGLALPFHNRLSGDEVARVAAALAEALR